MEKYIQRLERLEEVASGFDGVPHSFAIQAGSTALDDQLIIYSITGAEVRCDDDAASLRQRDRSAATVDRLAVGVDEALY